MPPDISQDASIAGDDNVFAPDKPAPWRTAYATPHSMHRLIADRCHPHRVEETA